MYEAQFDVHTHTLVSGHAYCTVTEMVNEAARQGLPLFGMTEHAKGIPGTCSNMYFLNLKVIPRVQQGVKLLFGSEINILDYNGTLSLPEHVIQRLDLRIAGIHNLCYENGTLAQNTSAVLAAIRNPAIDIISHPVDGDCPMDYEALARAAGENDVFLEINNHAIRTNRLKDAYRNSLEMLHWCRKLDVPVIMGSDAHHTCDVANFDACRRVLEEANFPEELVINRSAEEFLTFLRKKGRDV